MRDWLCNRVGGQDDAIDIGYNGRCSPCAHGVRVGTVCCGGVRRGFVHLELDLGEFLDRKFRYAKLQRVAGIKLDTGTIGGRRGNRREADVDRGGLPERLDLGAPPTPC